MVLYMAGRVLWELGNSLVSGGSLEGYPLSQAITCGSDIAVPRGLVYEQVNKNIL